MASLDLLPFRSGDPASNMATDFLLLQRYPDPSHARFRSYGWYEPAFTFGYGQKWAEVEPLLPPDTPVAVGRRPTGGGLVDHRNDFTYALVLPRGHELADAPAPVSYAAIHQMWADLLNAQGAEVIRQGCELWADPKQSGRADACFARAEPDDLVRLDTGAKVAGAAQKRSKHGLLIQGTFARDALPGLDWATFEADIPETLARLLELPLGSERWPELNDDEVDALTDHYRSPEWVRRR